MNKLGMYALIINIFTGLMVTYMYFAHRSLNFNKSGIGYNFKWFKCRNVAFYKNKFQRKKMS